MLNVHKLWNFATQCVCVCFSYGADHSDRTMALGLNQPLTLMSTKNISCGVKAAGT